MFEEKIFFGKDFRGTVRRIGKYLGKELTEERLDQLEKWCSFETMKANPKVNYNWFKEWGFTNQSFAFLRKGFVVSVELF